MRQMFGVAEEIVTRKNETEAQYRKHYANLEAQFLLGGHFRAEAPKSAAWWLALVRWFVAQEGRWAKSTIRAYRAALAYVVENSVYDAGARDEILQDLGKAIAPVNGKNPRTASVKRKSVSQFDVKRLIAALDYSSSIDVLVAGFLRLAPLVALRPSEFLSARLSGDQLKVRNAKFTNGRANGVFRELDLAQLSSEERAALKGFLAGLQRACRQFRSTKHLLNCIAARLARVCTKLKIRRVSLYTLRHVGLATAKRHMSSREVAALAGHRSCATATRHYAKRRTGWLKLNFARPTIETINAVNDDEYRSSLLLKLGRCGWKYGP
jgi:integrase